MNTTNMNKKRTRGSYGEREETTSFNMVDGNGCEDCPDVVEERIAGHWGRGYGSFTNSTNEPQEVDFREDSLETMQWQQDESRNDEVAVHSFGTPCKKGRRRRFVIPDDDEMELLKRTSSTEPGDEQHGSSRSQQGKDKSPKDKVRERNRIAAQQCRWRLKRYIQRLEEEKHLQEQLNIRITEECSRVEREQEELRQEESNMWQYLFQQILPSMRSSNHSQATHTMNLLHSILETPAPDRKGSGTTTQSMIRMDRGINPTDLQGSLDYSQVKATTATRHSDMDSMMHSCDRRQFYLS